MVKAASGDLVMKVRKIKTNRTGEAACPFRPRAWFGIFLARGVSPHAPSFPPYLFP